MKSGWQEKRFGEILQRTETINPQQSPDAQFRYIDVSSVSNQTFRIEETQLLYGKDAPSRARRLVRTDDVLFATVRPTLRRIAIVPSELDRQVCSTGYFVLRPIRDVSHRFVFYSLFTHDFMHAMEKLQKGASYPAVTDSDVRSQIVSLPSSLAEQHRIVSVLDRAFADIATAKLNTEAKLRSLDELAMSLLGKALSGALRTEGPQAWPIPVTGISTTDLHAGVLAMAYQMHDDNDNLPFFTHVKAEKIAHMVESRLGIDLGRNPMKDAAGPNDFPHLKKVEHRARMANYFDFRAVDDGSYRVRPLPGFARLIERTRAALGDHSEKVEDLLRWMLPMSVRQAEIVATVYAGWNNLLLKGASPTDDQIAFEARENWHPEKLKIERERFLRAITWMRSHGVVPTGLGKPVEHKGR